MSKAVGPTPGLQLVAPPPDDNEPEGADVEVTGTEDTPGVLPEPIV